MQPEGSSGATSLVGDPTGRGMQAGANEIVSTVREIRSSNGPAQGTHAQCSHQVGRNEAQGSGRGVGEGIGRGVGQTLGSVDRMGARVCGQRFPGTQGTPDLWESQATLRYGTHLTDGTLSQPHGPGSATQLSNQGSTQGNTDHAGPRAEAGLVATTAPSSSQRLQSGSLTSVPETVRSISSLDNSKTCATLSPI